MMETRLPPHRASVGASTLQCTSSVKVQDSELATVLSQRGPALERQITIALWLEPTVQVAGVHRRVQYFVVPAVEWDQDASLYGSLPLWVDVWAEQPFKLERYRSAG